MLTLLTLLMLLPGCRSNDSLPGGTFILPPAPSSPSVFITVSDLDGIEEAKAEKIVDVYAQWVFCVQAWKNWEKSVALIVNGKES